MTNGDNDNKAHSPSIFTVRDPITGKFRRATDTEMRDNLMRAHNAIVVNHDGAPASDKRKCLCALVWKAFFIFAFVLLLYVAFGMAKAKAGTCRAICDTSGRNCSTYCTSDGTAPGQLYTGSDQYQRNPRYVGPERYDPFGSSNGGGLQRSNDGFYSAPNYGGLRQ